MTNQIVLSDNLIETLQAVECPHCREAGIVDASIHFFFQKDELALRCRTCRKIWSVDWWEVTGPGKLAQFR